MTSIARQMTPSYPVIAGIGTIAMLLLQAGVCLVMPFGK